MLWERVAPEGLGRADWRRTAEKALTAVIQVYRPRLVGHRFGAYAARATAESCSSRIAAGGLKPCRSISQVAL